MRRWGFSGEARLRSVSRLGELAGEYGVAYIPLAGDIQDMEALSQRSLNRPLERMRRFSSVHWHLLPGNHDPHRTKGLLDQLLCNDLPANTSAHVVPEPAVVEKENFVLLPAALFHRRTLDGLTSYMDDMDLPEGLIRIGLTCFRTRILASARLTLRASLRTPR